MVMGKEHKMKFVFFFVFIFTSLFSSLVWADFEAAEAANQKGDRDSAFKAYYSAAFEKDHRAYGKLASMYLYGLGTAKDYVSAYAWFAMAQESGDKYSGQFKKAAASRLSREELTKAETLFAELKQKLPLPEKPKK